MARRNVMQRLTWCSREQLESIAKNIGFDVAEIPAGADAPSRAKLLYEWATSIRGPGLLSLEAAIPWSVEPEMSRQFEVQKMAGTDDAGSAPSFSSQAQSTGSRARPITINNVSPAPVIPAAPPATSVSADVATPDSETPKPTIWEGSTFTETYTPRSAGPLPDRSEATHAAASATPSLPHAGSETRELTNAPKLSPDEAVRRVERPETPHGLPAYGERAEAESQAQAEAQPSNDPDLSDAPRGSSNKWWRNLLGKGGK